MLPETTYTTAPVEYDGFGTVEVDRIAGNGKTRDGAPIRIVQTPAEHVQWQRTRYNSGNHFAYDAAGWAENGDYYTR